MSEEVPRKGQYSALKREKKSQKNLIMANEPFIQNILIFALFSFTYVPFLPLLSNNP